MFPLDTISSVGFEQDIAYICIWGKPEEFTLSDKGGYIYVFSSNNFEQIGKDYEWQNFLPVLPKEVKQFNSVVNGMIYCDTQVYFVEDESIMDHIVADKDNRAPILKDLISENQKIGKNFRKFN
ncbi:MAG: hypothetical protein Q7K16_04245 [Candidatus Azambacteria bacterium]|nr:hypothetical protein [Candidatus Azambacteria bacterium]